MIFEVERDARARGEKESVLADWRRRFDAVVVVTAPDAMKVARYAERTSPDGAGPDTKGRAAAEADARVRLAHQISDAEKAARADYVIENARDMATLKTRVVDLWERLMAESNKSAGKLSLE